MLLKFMMPAVFNAHPFALMQCTFKGMQSPVTGLVTQSRLVLVVLLDKLQSNATNRVENAESRNNI